MQIDIHAQGFSLTGALRDHTELRLRFALACVSDRVGRITVRLFDINGPRGGNDKRCRIQVMLNGLTTVAIEDTEPNLYLAIDRASDRAGRNVMRRLARHGAWRVDGSPDQLTSMKGSET